MRLLAELGTIADRRLALQRLTEHALARATHANGLRLIRSQTARDVVRFLPAAWRHVDALDLVVRTEEAVRFGGGPLPDALFADCLAASGRCSSTMARPDAAGQGAGHALPLVIVAAAIVALLVVTAWQREYTLDRSAIGFDGLAAWLSKAGVEARTFNGGDRLTHERAGLRVYPLFNPDDGKGGAAASPGAPRRSADRAVKAAVVRTKLAALPTLLVLPKWEATSSTAAFCTRNS